MAQADRIWRLQHLGEMSMPPGVQLVWWRWLSRHRLPQEVINLIQDQVGFSEALGFWPTCSSSKSLRMWRLQHLGGMSMPPGVVWWSWLSRHRLPEEVINLIQDQVGFSEALGFWQTCSITAVTSCARTPNMVTASTSEATTLMLPGELEFVFDDVTWDDVTWDDDVN